jgi:hypothetical protein
VVERDPNTKGVVSCHCEFGLYYGKGSKVWNKRRITSNKKYLKTILSRQLQVPHTLTSFGSIMEYSKLSDEERSPIFRMPFHTKEQFNHIIKEHRFHAIIFWTK